MSERYPTADDGWAPQLKPLRRPMSARERQLLEACREALRWLDEIDGDILPDGVPPHRQLRTAIAAYEPED